MYSRALNLKARNYRVVDHDIQKSRKISKEIFHRCFQPEIDLEKPRIDSSMRLTQQGPRNLKEGGYRREGVPRVTDR
jgi:hypothetical protein